jgi:hypothetical protein
MYTVYVWPDYTWCFQDELEDLLKYMSDDFNKFCIQAANEEDLDKLILMLPV